MDIGFQYCQYPALGRDIGQYAALGRDIGQYAALGWDIGQYAALGRDIDSTEILCPPCSTVLSWKICQSKFTK